MPIFGPTMFGGVGDDLNRGILGGYGAQAGGIFPQMQQPQQQQSPFGISPDMLVALGAGIAGGRDWGSGIGQGLQGALQVKQANQTRMEKYGDRNAVFQTLIARGVNPQQAWLMANSPQTAQMLAAEKNREEDVRWRETESGRTQRNADRAFGLQSTIANRPNVQIIEGPDGQKLPFLVDPNTGTVRLAPIAGAPTPTVSAPSAQPGSAPPTGSFTGSVNDAFPQRSTAPTGSLPGFGPSPPDVKNEGALRKEFTDQTSNYVDVRRSFDRIVASKDNAAGDISTVFSFMRMMDPKSTVREGEFATAENSGGIPAYVRNLYNKALTGERLTPTQREQFRQQAQELYNKAEAEYDALEKHYRGVAKQYRMDPDRIIPQRGQRPKLPAWNDPLGIR